MENFNASLEVKNTMRLYRQFLKLHNVTSQNVYANILWQWPKYLKNNR